MEATAGTVQVQKGLNIGYMAQEAKYASERTVMEEMTSGDEEIRRLLDEKHSLKKKIKRIARVMEIF